MDNSTDVASSPSYENQPVMPLEQDEGSSNKSCLKLSPESRDRYRCESMSSEGLGSDDDNNAAITVEDLEIPTVLHTNTRHSGVPPLRHFYFYQGKVPFMFTIIVQTPHSSVRDTLQCYIVHSSYYSSLKCCSFCILLMVTYTTIYYDFIGL